MLFRIIESFVVKEEERRRTIVLCSPLIYKCRYHKMLMSSIALSSPPNTHTNTHTHISVDFFFLSRPDQRPVSLFRTDLPPPLTSSFYSYFSRLRRWRRCRLCLLNPNTADDGFWQCKQKTKSLFLIHTHTHRQTSPEFATSPLICSD